MFLPSVGSVVCTAVTVESTVGLVVTTTMADDADTELEVAIDAVTVADAAIVVDAITEMDADGAMDTDVAIDTSSEGVMVTPPEVVMDTPEFVMATAPEVVMATSCVESGELIILCVAKTPSVDKPGVALTPTAAKKCTCDFKHAVKPLVAKNGTIPGKYQTISHKTIHFHPYFMFNP